VEQEGQRRGAAARQDADLVIWLLDGEGKQILPPVPGPGEAPRLLALSKADLVEGSSSSSVPPVSEDGTPLLTFSSHTGQGLDQLKTSALEMLAPGWDRRERPLITRLRQKGCLQRAVASLNEARQLTAGGSGEEMIVMPLGQVLAELASLTGRGDLEEVYDRIFSSFCIGK
jgi:tRNA modification GTPase